MELPPRRRGCTRQLCWTYSGTSTITRVGARITIVAIEYFVKIAPSVGGVGGEGSMCRMVMYHNKACGGATPPTAELFDSNNFFSGRNVNYAKKYALLEDITHQMVITSFSTVSSAAFSAGPAFFKVIRLTPHTTVQYGERGNHLRSSVGRLRDCIL